ncbi:peroxidase 17-like [Salvia miltiorrhiza]|uniref:peroxidase 17-like n=1 Tax=Salvia miltiorrhiza TaxID=226208 RepID=UPI0025ACC1FC|nr:peroxidase 17-like [Salvia miltiorrhiza]
MMSHSGILLVLLLLSSVAAAALSLRRNFYLESCPEAEVIARDVLSGAMAGDARAAASVMRLQFHDCLVNGCDGSLLLDETAAMAGEKSALSNVNSLRSFQVIDEIKEALEKACPTLVSCADILIMAARDAVFLSGGPKWEVKLARQDSLTASQEASNEIMPSPRANATSLIALFTKFNLSVQDLVALSGSHSIGKARCFSIVFRLYNQSGSGQPDPDIDSQYRVELDKLCPQGGDGNVTGDLDATPQRFDNQYYKDLVRGRGFLNSDQTLFALPQTRKYVEIFSKNQERFFKAFVQGIIKLGDLQSGKPGEIRRNCRVVNNISY